MIRETTCYETNNLDILKFTRLCKYYLYVYDHKNIMLNYDHKKIMLNEVAKVIWKMIQEDVFNVANSEIYFNKLINDIGYNYFMMYMQDMCYIVDQNEPEYYQRRTFYNEDCISLIGKPIYEFLNKIEELIPYED